MPSDATHHPDDRRARDAAIVEALMVPFSVIVGDVLRHRAPEVPLPDWNQPVQAFFFDQPSFQRAVPACADNDQVRTPFPGFVHDDPAWVAVSDARLN